MKGVEAVLGGGAGERTRDVGQKEFLQDFSSRAEKRDGSISRAFICRFARFDNRNDDGGLPDGRNVSAAHGEVEQRGEIRYASSAQMLVVQVGNVIRTHACGVACQFYCFGS